MINFKWQIMMRLKEITLIWIYKFIAVDHFSCVNYLKLESDVGIFMLH